MSNAGRNNADDDDDDDFSTNGFYELTKNSEYFNCCCHTIKTRNLKQIQFVILVKAPRNNIPQSSQKLSIIVLL